MEPELFEQCQSTVLVVADDAGMLAILHRVLTGRGYRVLLAPEAASADTLLDQDLGVDTLMIQVGLTGAERIELKGLTRGAEVLFLGGIVESGIIRLRVPERRVDYAPRILIVADEPALRALFDRHLAEDGYHVTAVETWGQALEAAQKTRFDVGVVDLSLPESDGIEAIRNWRSDFPWMKILAVSANETAGLPSLALAAGAAAILGKPATAWELREAVYRLLDPAGRWHEVMLSVEGFRAVSAKDGTEKTWGWESGRSIGSLAHFLV